MSKAIKFEEKKKNLQNQSITSKNDLENKKRTTSIIEGLYNMFDRSKLDPILETFKSNEMLKEFYMKRIYELMKEYFQNEKEKRIELLTTENQSYCDKIKILEEELSEINHTYHSTRTRLEEEISKLESELKSKENFITDLKTQIDIIKGSFSEANKKFFDLSEEYKNTKSTNEKIAQESQSLNKKIFILENEVDDLFRKNKEIQEYVKKLEDDCEKKEIHLTFFKENFDLMKNKHDEISNVINNLIDENKNLKFQLEEKLSAYQEIIKNFDNLKIDFQTKEDEAKILMNQNEELKNKIENVYKIKIKALKIKLKEKLELIHFKEKEFKEFIEEKEKLINRLLNKR